VSELTLRLATNLSNFHEICKRIPQTDQKAPLIGLNDNFVDYELIFDSKNITFGVIVS